MEGSEGGDAGGGRSFVAARVVKEGAGRASRSALRSFSGRPSTAVDDASILAAMGMASGVWWLRVEG